MLQNHAGSFIDLEVFVMKHVAEFLNDVITNESLKKELGECVAKADTSAAKVKLVVQFASDAGHEVYEEDEK
jgi:hypothetical protein